MGTATPDRHRSPERDHAACHNGQVEDRKVPL
ncbi:hypothetical protein Ae168Ps1_1377 [Pseudonocardia sp. Ae168_Ps1]|nr:hypothetical protein Ae150APs1_1372 [Pseudonocardia sp. Ae150A_Ps1]OLL78971.1 hypothetical protein Ae168Ps1_1377 [Pseudonocardia sp. Ae168_Ps1]OLL86892.1 hypothetical protein Ae263Ps1_3947c [Pseudonocardia sp. Ae263_Ps1]OLL93063.1 hypothetical protein Ae356Ps1_2960 [Pseudonocardia sp. Ae356_Ps1]